MNVPLVVPVAPGVAAELAPLLRDGLMRANVERRRVSVEALAVIEAFNLCAAKLRVPVPVEQASTAWLSTDEAAVVLDVGPRRVRQLGREQVLASRMVSGRLEFDAADVFAHADRRGRGSQGKSGETAEVTSVGVDVQGGGVESKEGTHAT